jgi:hypothetical protein
MRCRCVGSGRWLLAVVVWSSVVVGLLMGFSDGAKRNSVSLEPSFAPLEEGASSFVATIYDESTVTEIQDVSFFGHTSIGGIRKDTDDSTNKLELGKMRELVVVKSTYESTRFGDREFSLAKVVAANGAVIDNLLIPKHVIICGVEKKTQMERSWFLSKIDKVVIEKQAKAEAPEVVIEKAYKKEQEKWVAPAEKRAVAEAAAPAPSKQVVQVPEEKKSGFAAAAKRLWDDVVDVAGELVKTVKGWFN